MAAPILPVPAMSDFHCVKTTLVSIPTDYDTARRRVARARGRNSARRGPAVSRQHHELLHRRAALPAAGADAAGLCLPRLQPPRPRHPRHPQQPRCGGCGLPDVCGGDRRQPDSRRGGWRRRGFPDPIVIGHSNGGMLAVRHVAEHPETPALVLLSAHCGGKDMLPLASKAGLLAQDRLEEITDEAEELVEEQEAEGADAAAGLVVRHHGGELPRPARTARTSWSSRRRSPARFSICAATRSCAICTPRRNLRAAQRAPARCKSFPTAITSTSAARRRLQGVLHAG